MITLTIALVMAVVASLRLKQNITDTERCVFNSHLGSMLAAACLPILIAAMYNILSLEIYGVILIITTGIVFKFTKMKYTKVDKYITCDCK